jgi:hypothetical protein
MKKIWSLLHYRIVWTIGTALLAIVAVPAILVLVLKALGLAHGASLHSWLLDVGQNMGPMGAAGGAGAGVGGSGGPNPNPQKDKDPDPCAGQERAVLAAKGTVDMLNGQLNLDAEKINSLAAPAQKLLDRAAALAPAAQSEVAQQFALTAITKLIQLVAEAAGPLGEGAAAVNTAVGIATNPVGTAAGGVPGNSIVENAGFLKEMYQYFQVSQGDLKALEELCKETPGGLPDAQQFLNVMDQLNELVAQGNALVNQMDAENGIQQQLNKALETLNQDEKDLLDCQATNSGSDASAATA